MQMALTPEGCFQALSSMRNKHKSRYSTFFLKRNCKRLTFSLLQGNEVRGKSHFGQFSWAKTAALWQFQWTSVMQHGSFAAKGRQIPAPTTEAAPKCVFFTLMVRDSNRTSKIKIQIKCGHM